MDDSEKDSEPDDAFVTEDYPKVNFKELSKGTTGGKRSIFRRRAGLACWSRKNCAREILGSEHYHHLSLNLLM
jgi:hypothetical protein